MYTISRRFKFPEAPHSLFPQLNQKHINFSHHCSIHQHNNKYQKNLLEAEYCEFREDLLGRLLSSWISLFITAEFSTRSPILLQRPGTLSPFDYGRFCCVSITVLQSSTILLLQSHGQISNSSPLVEAIQNVQVQ